MSQTGTAHSASRSKAPTYVYFDYNWRAMDLVSYPWYFFHAATDVRTGFGSGCMLWHEEVSGTNVRRH
eukprot:981927-Karenia_brevis.AAC.1